MDSQSKSEQINEAIRKLQMVIKMRQLPDQKDYAFSFKNSQNCKLIINFYSPSVSKNRLSLTISNVKNMYKEGIDFIQDMHASHIKHKEMKQNNPIT